MKKIALFVATAFMLQACGGDTTTTTKTTTTTTTKEAGDEPEQMFDNVPEHSEDEHGMSYDEYLATYKDENYTLKEGEKGGVYHLLSLEDGGYPSAILNAVKYDTDDTVNLYVMLEGGFTGFNSQQLHEAVNNTHDAYLVYAEKVELHPQEMILDGDKDTGEGKSVTGTLEVHRENMGGDLPGRYLVITDEGKKVMFTDFFDESLVESHGKHVKQYYYEHRQQELKHIVAIK